MRRRHGNKNYMFLFGVFAGLICVMTVGYAAFSTTLNINVKGNIGKKELKPTDLVNEVVTEGDGLYKDINEEGKYVYRGANPNNYIIFNNETWRILAVEADGTLKIIRDDSIDGIAWNTNNTNAWDNSSINKYLNSDFYNTLGDNAQLVELHTFNVGPVPIAWDEEISNTSIKQDLNNEKAITWDGNIGLLNATDYVRASLDDRCVSARGSWVSNTDFPCSNKNWINEKKLCWTINAVSGSQDLVWLIGDYIGAYETKGTLSVDNAPIKTFPTTYLKSEITLSGKGTEEEPYIIK